MDKIVWSIKLTIVWLEYFKEVPSFLVTNLFLSLSHRWFNKSGTNLGIQTFKQIILLPFRGKVTIYSTLFLNCLP